MNHSNTQWKDGHAQVHAELAWRGEDWIAWSEKNPGLAAIVWPVVLQILRKEATPHEAKDGAYVLLLMTRHSANLAEVHGALNRYAEYRWISLALEEQERKASH